MMHTFEEKITFLYTALSGYFKNEHFTIDEVQSGRTNLNFFLSISEKKYFLRTNILKVPEDNQFGGKLEKEYRILNILGNMSISAKPYYFYKGEDIQFLLLEHLAGSIPTNFLQDQENIIEALSRLQHINISLFSFLEKNTLSRDFEEKIFQRIKLIQDKEIRDILEQITQLFPYFHGKIEEEFCLCHSDFRADNILTGKDTTSIIDVEGMIIADRYIDIAEYYVGGIFWNTFQDRNSFDYDEYTNFLNKYKYSDPLKQRYLYLLQYCSYLSWISMHISTTQNPLDMYTKTLAINRKKYYRDIQPFIKKISS